MMLSCSVHYAQSGQSILPANMLCALCLLRAILIYIAAGPSAVQTMLRADHKIGILHDA